MGDADKRRARRFELQLPVTVLAVGDKAATTPVRTKDISSTGMFLEFDENVEAGTKVEMVVDLPQEITHAGQVRLRCTGRVVRVDRTKASRTGVAVTIERYEFTRLPDDATEPSEPPLRQ